MERPGRRGRAGLALLGLGSNEMMEGGGSRRYAWKMTLESGQ